jgi:mannosyl-3-phosphoglycerate phosphatase
MQPNSQLIIYTDLDGTLLDHDSYAADAALPALRAAQHCGIPVIFCSSKTRAEIEAWRETLNVHDPFIVENGGAIYVPVGYFPFALERGEPCENYLRIELGTPYSRLVAALRSLREHERHQLAGFSDLTAEEIAVVCNLPIAAARCAQAREYDEPFRLLTPSPETELAVRQQIERAGLACSAGGRFWHLHGANDKGRAVKLLSLLFRQAFGRIFTVGLGDSQNDASLLAAVDWPVLVQRPDGSFTSGLTQRIPHLNFAQACGPRGWHAAITHVLRRIYARDAHASLAPASEQAPKA